MSEDYFRANRAKISNLEIPWTRDVSPVRSCIRSADTCFSGGVERRGYQPTRFAALRHSGAASGVARRWRWKWRMAVEVAEPVVAAASPPVARFHPLSPESVGCQARRESVVSVRTRPVVVNLLRCTSVAVGRSRSRRLLLFSLLSFTRDRYSESVTAEREDQWQQVRSRSVKTLSVSFPATLDAHDVLAARRLTSVIRGCCAREME